jgi:hypothetical protein
LYILAIGIEPSNISLLDELSSFPIFTLKLFVSGLLFPFPVVKVPVIGQPFT